MGYKEREGDLQRQINPVDCVRGPREQERENTRGKRGSLSTLIRPCENNMHPRSIYLSRAPRKIEIFLGVRQMAHRQHTADSLNKHKDVEAK